MSCSASFTASAGFQVGSAAMQTTAATANARMRKIFINVTIRSAVVSEGEIFSAGTSFHRNYYFSSGVSFFYVADRIRQLLQRVSTVDHWFHFSRLHEIGQNDQIVLLRVRQHHTHFLAHERFQQYRFEQT